jgi:hypothetical protein
MSGHNVVSVYANLCQRSSIVHIYYSYIYVYKIEAIHCTVCNDSCIQT